jgi:ribosomal protein S18 acetylase RimI-like enzyme
MERQTVEYQIVESNLRASFRILAGDRPRSDVREVGGISIASAGVTFQMFNAAFLAAPVASDLDLERRLLVASTHFQQRGLEWAFWNCDGYLESGVRRHARKLFEKRSLHLSADLPGMIAERVLPPVRPLPPMEVRRVADDSSCAAFCQIGSSCFNVPLPWFREVFENRVVWEQFAGYVAYVYGEPVSTAATVVSAGAVGVYNVATLVGFQRQGYGEAVMRHALAEARAEHGIERTILQSTAQGLPIYQRMGYRTVTRVSVYSS